MTIRHLTCAVVAAGLVAALVTPAQASPGQRVGIQSVTAITEVHTFWQKVAAAAFWYFRYARFQHPGMTVPYAFHLPEHYQPWRRYYRASSCHERRVRDMPDVLKGAFGTFNDLKAPFMTEPMSRTRSTSSTSGWRPARAWPPSPPTPMSTRCPSPSSTGMR